MKISEPMRLSILWGVLLGVIAGALLPGLHLFGLIFSNPYFSPEPLTFALTEFSNNSGYLLFGTISSATVGGSIGLILGVIYGGIAHIILASFGDRPILTSIGCLCFSIISAGVVYLSVSAMQRAYSVSENWRPDSMPFMGSLLALGFTLYGCASVAKKLRTNLSVAT